MFGPDKPFFLCCSSQGDAVESSRDLDVTEDLVVLQGGKIADMAVVLEEAKSASGPSSSDSSQKSSSSGSSSSSTETPAAKTRKTGTNKKVRMKGAHAKKTHKRKRRAIAPPATEDYKAKVASGEYAPLKQGGMPKISRGVRCTVKMQPTYGPKHEPASERGKATTKTRTFVSDDPGVAAKQMLPPLKGTRAQLVTAMTEYFHAQVTRAQYLVLGELFEVTPPRLLQISGPLALTSNAHYASFVLTNGPASPDEEKADAALSAGSAQEFGVVGLHALAAHAKVEAEAKQLVESEVVASGYVYYATGATSSGAAIYRRIQPGDKVGVVYQLHNPLKADAEPGDNQFGQRSFTFRQLVRTTPAAAAARRRSYLLVLMVVLLLFALCCSPGYGAPEPGRECGRCWHRQHGAQPDRVFDGRDDLEQAGVRSAVRVLAQGHAEPGRTRRRRVRAVHPHALGAGCGDVREPGRHRRRHVGLDARCAPPALHHAGDRSVGHRALFAASVLLAAARGLLPRHGGRARANC